MTMRGYDVSQAEMGAEPDEIDPALLTDEEHAIYEAMLEAEWDLAMAEATTPFSWSVLDDLPASDPGDEPF